MIRNMTLLLPALALSLPSACHAAKAKAVVDGTSHMQEITSAWFEAIQKANGDIVIVDGVSGATAGFIRFANGTVDISKSAILMRKNLRRLCEKNGVQFIEMLVAHSADRSESLSFYVNTSTLNEQAVRDTLRYCLSDAGQQVASRFGAPLSSDELMKSRRTLEDAIQE